MSTTFIPAVRIAGQTIEGVAHDVVDPATGSAIARVGWAGSADVELAVEAGAAAFASWSTTPARQRAAALRAIAADLRAEAAEIAPIIAAE